MDRTTIDRLGRTLRTPLRDVSAAADAVRRLPKRYGPTPVYDRLLELCDELRWPVGIARYDLQQLSWLVLEVHTPLGLLVVNCYSGSIDTAADVLLPHLRDLATRLDDR